MIGTGQIVVTDQIPDTVHRVLPGRRRARRASSDCVRSHSSRSMMGGW